MNINSIYQEIDNYQLNKSKYNSKVKKIILSNIINQLMNIIMDYEYKSTKIELLFKSNNEKKFFKDVEVLFIKMKHMIHNFYTIYTNIKNENYKMYINFEIKKKSLNIYRREIDRLSLKYNKL